MLDIEVPTGVGAASSARTAPARRPRWRCCSGWCDRRRARPPCSARASKRPRATSTGSALIEAPSFWPGLTGVQNLRALAVLGGHDESQIRDARARRPRRAGLGPVRRLLIRDEAAPRHRSCPLGIPRCSFWTSRPTASIRRDQRDARLHSVGRRRPAQLVSSHILSELEQVCDWLIVIDRGSLVYQGPTQGFLSRAGTVVALAPEHLRDLNRLAELARADGHRAAPEATS